MKRRRYEVLFVAASADLHRLNGETQHVLEITKSLAMRGHRIHLVCRGAAEMKLDAGHGGRIVGHEVSSSRVPGIGLAGASLSAWRICRRLLQSESIDVVHERNNFVNPGRIAGQLARVPCIVELNGIPSRELAAKGYPDLAIATAQWLNARDLRRADGIVAVAESMIPLISAEYGIDARRITHIENGVDVAAFSRARPRRVPEVPDDAIVTGFVGSFSPWHGIDVLIEAAKIVKNDHPRFRLVLLGDGPGRPAVLRRIQQEALESVVIAPGRVPPSEVPAFVKGFDIGIVLKNPKVPGAPIKYYEYMAAGIPIVATDCIDFKAVASEGIGSLCDPTDAHAVAASIIGLMQDQKTRNERGERARRLATARHSWSAVSSRTEEIYDRVVTAAEKHG